MIIESDIALGEAEMDAILSELDAIGVRMKALSERCGCAITVSANLNSAGGAWVIANIHRPRLAIAAGLRPGDWWTSPEGEAHRAYQATTPAGIGVSFLEFQR